MVPSRQLRSQRRQDKDLLLYVGRSPDAVGFSLQSHKEVGKDGTITVVERYADDVRLVGQGFFTLDFLLYDLVGIDLRELPDPAIRALRLPPRVFTPFLVMLILSFLTPRGERQALDRFYVKMKTPTEQDPEADRAELEKSYAEPDRYDAKKLFPGTKSRRM